MPRPNKEKGRFPGLSLETGRGKDRWNLGGVAMSKSDSDKYVEELLRARDYLKAECPSLPSVGIILGSGLGGFGEHLQDKKVIPYSDIPYFPKSSVQGHSGNLIVGKVGGKVVAAMQGRVHQYEGHSGAVVAFAPRVLCLLGIKTLIVSNAAGGLAPELQPGSLLALNNLIGFFSDNPSRGLNHELLGPHFYDVSHPFDLDLLRIVEEQYAKLNIPFHDGVYALTRGPAYETAAEIKALRNMGADAVGMSTVPEVLAARQMGIKCIGMSLITNLAAGVSLAPLNHLEVMEAAKEAAERFQSLMKAVILNLP